MSKFKIQSPIEHLPKPTLVTMFGQEYHAKLMAAWNWKSVDIDDGWYYYPSWEDWGKIFLHVQKNLPKYVPDIFDCDNFGFYIAVMVSKDFGCNTCNVVEGMADVGRGILERHKWNVFFDGVGFYQLESQKYVPMTDISDLTNPKYIPEEIIAF